MIFFRRPRDPRRQAAIKVLQALEPLSYLDARAVVRAAAAVYMLKADTDEEARALYRDERGDCSNCGEPIAYADQYGCPAGFAECTHGPK